MGPYRLGTEPYYQSLSASARVDPSLLSSRPRQLSFTVGYVASRARESLALVLDNAYRLYSRPANDYKWDYPMPYRAQVGMQGLVVVLAVFGALVAWRDRRPLIGAAFLPAAVVVLHALSYPWPRFNQPTMLILIAFGATTLVALRSAERRALVLGGAFVGLALLVLATREPLLRSAIPSLARVTTLLAWALALAAAFQALRTRIAPRGTFALALIVIAVPVVAHAHRDRAWHELSIALDADRGAEQRLALDAAACTRLRIASEAFVVMDLEPAVHPDDLEVRINGRPTPALAATMARFGESTSAGGRDRRDYPQWWAVPLDRVALDGAGGCALRIELRPHAGAGVRLKADRFPDQDLVYEGPSFGEWPLVSTVKLEHDGDPRLVARRTLSSRATESVLLEKSGPRVVAYRHRIRVITLARNEGFLTWRIEAPSAPRSSIVFSAYSGDRGEAELWIDGARGPAFPLGATRDFEVAGGGFVLQHAAQPMRGGMAYGRYTLALPAPLRGRAIEMSVRFRSGMSIDPMFFSLDRRGLDTGTIIDAHANSYPAATGRWGVAEVF
jgi:hypothetical protein